MHYPVTLMLNVEHKLFTDKINRLNTNQNLHADYMQLRNKNTLTKTCCSYYLSFELICFLLLLLYFCSIEIYIFLTSLGGEIT